VSISAVGATQIAATLIPGCRAVHIDLLVALRQEE